MGGCMDTLARLFVLACVVGGVVVQSFAALSCQFLTYTQDDQTGGIGPWFWEPVGEDCTRFEWNAGVVYMQVARASITLALIFGGLAAITLFMETFFCVCCCSGLINTVTMLGAQLFSGLVFLVYASDYCRDTGTCGIGQGAIYNIAAAGLYVLAGACSCCFGKPDQPLLKQCCNKKKNDDDDVEQLRLDEETQAY